MTTPLETAFELLLFDMKRNEVASALMDAHGLSEDDAHSTISQAQEMIFAPHISALTEAGILTSPHFIRINT